MPDSSQAGWRKSKRSGEGNCVEVKFLDDGSRVAMRDSKNKQGSVLIFSAAAWQTLIERLKAGSTI